MSKNTGQSMIALLTGAAIGAGIAILYAPDKGSKTRGKIRKGAQRAQRDLEAKLREAKGIIGAKAESVKANVGERLDDLLSDASYKAEDVLNALESKLEALKAQNAKLQKK